MSFMRFPMANSCTLSPLWSALFLGAIVFGTLYSADRGRYFVYNNAMGRFHNQVENTISAIFWSQMTNRTLVFPGWVEYEMQGSRHIFAGAVPMEKYINVDIFKSYVRWMPLQDYTSRVLPQMKSSDIDIITDIPNEHYNGNFTFSYVHSRLTNSSATILQVNIPYRWSFPERTKINLLKAFQPTNYLVSVAKNWIDKFLRRPYLAIHLRKWEGACKMPSSHMEVYLQREVFAKNFTIFLASDGQDREAEILIRRKYHSISFTDDMSKYGMYASGLVDFYILASSDVFLANRRSTLSRNAFNYRFSLCGKSPISSANPLHKDPFCHNGFKLVVMHPLNKTKDYACR
eukprot:TRINITY_DN4819_c0_g1_i1.p1 TRINITY_DN4819_c0_g1~~TRINITY_DN4819_c0_g1_i1.p1  ORF type:complete len:346 (+),score=50.90 TRINITY_DN4819_c0_g1_i1:184-1221(+)